MMLSSMSGGEDMMKTRGDRREEEEKTGKKSNDTDSLKIWVTPEELFFDKLKNL